MLIEFSVENYLCFKNKVTFSFEPMTDLEESKIFNPESRRKLDGVDNPEKVVDPETGKPITINTVNAIYGKNAAGKSTLLKSILQIFKLIMNSRKLNEDDDFNFDYFDEEAPAKFQLKFFQDNELYAYTIHLSGQENKACVNFEELINLNTKEVLFTRNDQTIHSQSFLNTAQQDVLNNDLAVNHLILSQPFSEFKILRETFSANKNDFMDVRILPKDMSSSFLRAFRSFSIGMPKSIQEKIMADPLKSFLLDELQKADFNIKDFKFDNDDELIFIDFRGKERFFGQQSDGTQKYFILLIDIHNGILENGGMYVVDELEKSLHPKLALRLIDIFKNPETNPKNARLLFTSHDVGFMHQSILNGDQVWFIERNDETQETKLSSAADADGFEPVYLQSDYMQGLYGAVPTIADDNK